MNTSRQQLVEFFFVGIGKCGTTWLYQLARRRKMLSVPSIKESYLIDSPPTKRTKLVDSLYLNQSKMADFSNVYYWDVENPQKIYDYNPHAKIVITVRRPSGRIQSHFEFLKRNGEYAKATLASYLDDGDCEQIVARTDYPRIIARYRTVFGESNILILPLEQLKSDPQRYVDRLTTFCGVERLELQQEDLAPALQRSGARVVALARLAKTVAVGLRKLGLLRLLAALKESAVLRKLLFKRVHASPDRDRDFGTRFADRIVEMDESYEAFLVDAVR